MYVFVLYRMCMLFCTLCPLLGLCAALTSMSEDFETQLTAVAQRSAMATTKSTGMLTLVSNVRSIPEQHPKLAWTL